MFSEYRLQHEILSIASAYVIITQHPILDKALDGASLDALSRRYGINMQDFVEQISLTKVIKLVDTYWDSQLSLKSLYLLDPDQCFKVLCFFIHPHMDSDPPEILQKLGLSIPPIYLRDVFRVAESFVEALLFEYSKEKTLTKNQKLS